jgi:hypothetical protein
MRGIGIRSVVVVALSGIVAVLMGCGGGGSTTNEGGDASLSKAQFVSKGDQICELNYTKRERVLSGYLAKAEREGGQLPLARQEKVLVDQIMPIFQEESEQLNGLGLPTTETQKAEAILEGLEAAIAAVESEPDVALEEGTAVQFGAVEKLARSYGFEFCGRS